ncbi:MAG: AMP-binding protein [Anaerolineae bacterium]
MVIGDYLGRRAIYSPARLAIVDAGKTPALRLTYAELNVRANNVAHWLRSVAGVRKGDRVGVLARDGVEHLDIFFACGKLGAIHTAFNWRLHWRELLTVVQETTPRILFYSDEFHDTVTSLADALAEKPGFFIPLDGADHSRRMNSGRTGVPPQGRPAPTDTASTQVDARRDAHQARFRSLASLACDGAPPEQFRQAYADIIAQAAPEPVTCPALEPEDTAALIFTGGTTGHAKGARITHRQIAWNTLNTVIHDLQHHDIFLNVFPLFHTGGLFVYTLPQIILGGATVLTRQFDPAQVLGLIEQERVTVFAGVPTMYELLTQAPTWATADLSSLRFCTSGGAPLPVPLVEKYTAEKQVRFKQGFGMTEFGPGVFALAPEDAIRKAGSIGRPNFYVDARVVDAENRPLGPDQVGELVLKGPSFASGYFNDEAASAAALDVEGWFHTGDLARYDAEWYFFIVGRKKDLFISGGENVYPAEIEAVLYRHPAVALAAVIGVPDERWGEVGRAFVTLKPGATATADELLAFMQANLARFKAPRRVVIVDAMPLSGAGKILKHELKARPDAA